MSIQIEILNSKLEITENSETIVDLTTQSFLDFENESFQRQYIVDNSMIMRPDLLTMEINNSMDFTELLKTNYI